MYWALDKLDVGGVAVTAVTLRKDIIYLELWETGDDN